MRRSLQALRRGWIAAVEFNQLGGCRSAQTFAGIALLRFALTRVVASARNDCDVAILTALMLTAGPPKRRHIAQNLRALALLHDATAHCHRPR